MAGYHGITGWSGGGRRPLTYSLMPGQMRNTRVNVYNNFIPMATCYYAEPQCNCNQDSGIPKWMQWTMFGGMAAQFLGGIFSGIFGGGGSEGAGGVSKKDVDAELDLKSIKDIYGKDYTITKFSNGTLRATPKKGGDTITANSPMELLDALDEAKTKKTTTTTTVDPALKKLAEDLGITITSDNPPKYKFGDKEYESLTDAVNAAKANPSAAQRVVSNEGALTPKVKTKDEVDAELKKMFPGGIEIIEENVEFNTDKGCYVVKASGKELNTFEDFYKEAFNGRTPVKFGENGNYNLSGMNGKTFDVIDNDEKIGDFTGLSVTNATSNEITLSNDRKYKIYKDNNDGHVYLQDMTSGDRNKQVYILDYATDGHYTLAQLKGLGNKTVGYGIAATKK